MTECKKRKSPSSLVMSVYTAAIKHNDATDNGYVVSIHVTNTSKLNIPNMVIVSNTVDQKTTAQCIICIDGDMVQYQSPKFNEYVSEYLTTLADDDCIVNVLPVIPLFDYHDAHIARTVKMAFSTAGYNGCVQHNDVFIPGSEYQPDVEYIHLFGNHTTLHTSYLIRTSSVADPIVVISKECIHVQVTDGIHVNGYEYNTVRIADCFIPIVPRPDYKELSAHLEETRYDYMCDVIISNVNVGNYTNAQYAVNNYIAEDIRTKRMTEKQASTNVILREKLKCY